MKGGESTLTVSETHDHLVQFYSDDRQLVQVVGRYLADALNSDAATVIICTGAHREAFESAFRRYGVDVATARAADRLVLVDAADSLKRFMRNGSPNADAFERVVGGLVERAAGEGRPVRAFGEMVALLWAEGHVAAAIELEDLWNSLGQRLPFTLLCAYPTDSLAGDEYATAVSNIVDRHTGVLGADGAVTNLAENQNAARAQAETFSHAYSAPAAARRLVEDALGAWGHGHLADVARLIVTELATNAIKHAGTDFSVSIAEQTGSVRITVRDGSTTAPELGQAGWLAGSGRGLSMVAELAERWGHDIAVDGKAVWAELAVDRTLVRH